MLLLAAVLTAWLFSGAPVAPPRGGGVVTLSAALLHPRHILLGANEDGIEEFTLQQSLMLSTSALLPRKRDLWTDIQVRRVPVLNQGQWGSCTGHAISYAWQNSILRTNASRYFLPSRCYFYAQSRILLGDQDLSGDDGSTMHATAQALSQRGAVEETKYPYTWTNISRSPPESIVALARPRRRRVEKVRFTLSIPTNIQAFKAQLAMNRLVMIGILVFSSWMESAAAMSSGKIPIPLQRDQCVGGHAIALSGWDDTLRVFTFRNSWGHNVGKGGVFQIPYDYVCNPRLAGDAWVVLES